MSATYLGTFPVRKIVSANIIGQGILVKTEKIIVSRNDASSYVPEINSPFIQDSNLWVTDAKLDYQDNGLAEITVVAHGKNENSSTTVEIQPGGVFISGLLVKEELTLNPPANSSSGATVKVSFVDSVNNEADVISTYSLEPMPSEINGIRLPPYTSPGIYGNPSLIAGPNNNDIPNPNYRITYKGYICKDIQTQRHGSALSVSLFYKESGFLETFEKTSAFTGTIKKLWEF